MKLPAPVLVAVDDQLHEVREPYPFDWHGVRYTILPGYKTDGLSKGRLLWRVLGHPFQGKELPGGVPHDALYATHLLPRGTADQLFLERLLENDVSPVKARIMYLGVRLGGWLRWNEATKESIAAARRLVRVDIGVKDETVKPNHDAAMDGAVALIAVLLALLAVLSVGCATVEFDPATGKAKYSRWGDQKVSLTVERTGPEAWKLGLTQESEAAALTEMAKTINKLAELAGTAR